MGGVPLDSGNPSVPGWPTRPTPGPRPRIRRARSPRPGCPLTIRSSVDSASGPPALRGGSRTAPQGCRQKADARVRSAPRLGFVRRRGSGSFGAAARVRSAPGLGFVRRRGSGSFGAAARVRSAPARGEAARPGEPPAPPDPHRAARLRTGGGRPGSLGAGVGSARRIGSPPCTRPGAVRNPRNREGHPGWGIALDSGSSRPPVGPGRDRPGPPRGRPTPGIESPARSSVRAGPGPGRPATAPGEPEVLAPSEPGRPPWFGPVRLRAARPPPGLASAGRPTHSAPAPSGPEAPRRANPGVRLSFTKVRVRAAPGPGAARSGRRAKPIPGAKRSQSPAPSEANPPRRGRGANPGVRLWYASVRPRAGRGRDARPRAARHRIVKEHPKSSPGALRIRGGMRNRGPGMDRARSRGAADPRWTRRPGEPGTESSTLRDGDTQEAVLGRDSTSGDGSWGGIAQARAGCHRRHPMPSG